MPKTSALQRHKFLTFLETEEGNYVLMNDGITDLTIEYNADSDGEHYIADKSATTVLGGYAPQFAVEQTAYEGEEIFTHVDKIRRNLQTGDEAKTSVLLVYPYMKDTEGAYNADKYDATIVINSFGGEGGGRLTIGYEVSLNGNPTFGTATIGDGKAEFVEGA